jgi:hypothetical protein
MIHKELLDLRAELQAIKLRLKNHIKIKLLPIKRREDPLRMLKLNLLFRKTIQSF